MSTKHHHTPGVMHDIKVMSEEQLQLEYGIEVMEDGRVWDPVDEITYPSLHDWAKIIEQDEDQGFEKFSHHKHFDDV